MYKKRHRDIACNAKFRKENFQTGFVVAGCGFLYFWNHKLIKFEEEKIFGLQKAIL